MATTVPLSVLDLAPISAGSTAAQALRDTIELARHADGWGYRRYWVAEHHFVATASSSPAVLIGLIAAATSTIRVGSAAVQVGHQTAAAVVEAFGTIDALHPGRIDLGLGRSGQRQAEATGAPPSRPTASPSRVGTVTFPAPFDATPVLQSPLLTAAATALRHPGAMVADFDKQLDDIERLLDGTFQTGDGVALTARPGTGATVQLWLFGSSGGQSARSAGARGLPFVANYHVSPGTTLDAVRAYRAAFRPSGQLTEPYVVVSADVLVAETKSEADALAAPFGQWVYSIRSGAGAVAYPDPASVVPLTAGQAAVVADRVSTRFVGTADSVAEQLRDLQRATGADELVITTITHDPRSRLRSFELLAKEWGLSG